MAIPDDLDDFEDGVFEPPPTPAPVFGGPVPYDPPTPDPPIDLGSFGGFGGGRPIFGFKPVPKFNAPKFARPTLEDAMREPGYQFRLQSGQQALERSAAAQGRLRTGGTLQELVEYGQNFGAQEYSNVFNRALGEYDRSYRAALGEFQPRLAEWQMLSNAELQAAMGEYNAARSAAMHRESMIGSLLSDPDPPFPSAPFQSSYTDPFRGAGAPQLWQYDEEEPFAA